MVAASQIKGEPIRLCFDALPKATVRAFEKCSKISVFSRGGWYLAGGTALALQVGHRRSVDLDFFTKRKIFDEKKNEEVLSTQGEWLTTFLSRGTLYGEFFGAKMSFIAYPFFTPTAPMRKHGTVSLLTPPDIAVMKVIAISQRGRKRDFFDLYWICQNIQSLRDSVLRVNAQYSVSQNLTHILKSLVYFEDADNDPEPVIFFKTNWKEVKGFFKKEVPFITKKLIHIK